MSGGPDVGINSRAPPMLNSSWDDDVTQKIEQHPDGTIRRHITVDGQEVKQEFHSSGSFKEWRSDGSTHTFDAKNGHTYSKGGTTTSIDNHGDVKMAGHSRISIDTDGHVEFNKNASIAVNGMAEIAAPKGHIKMSASEIAMSSTQGSISMSAARDFEMKTGSSDGGKPGGRMAIATQGVLTMQTSKGDIHMDSGGQTDWKTASDHSHSVGGNYSQSTSGDSSRTAGGNHMVKGGKMLTTYGAQQLTPQSDQLVKFVSPVINMQKNQVGPTDPMFA